MIKKLLSIIRNNICPIIFFGLLICAWQIISDRGIIPAFLLPSPLAIIRAFINDLPILLLNTKVTLYEAFMGLFIGITASYIIAMSMDRFRLVYKTLYPVLVATQTIPVITIAPVLVIWMGLGPAPKIAVVGIYCGFPLAIGLFDGFRNVDPDAVNLLKAMGAGKWQIFRHLKMPYSLGRFFSGLKISVSYAIGGAVIAEWLGGNEGLGVYMVRVKGSFNYSKMFAIVLLIMLVSFALIGLVLLLERKIMPWKVFEGHDNGKMINNIKSRRKIMKKFFTTLIIITLIFTFAGCAKPQQKSEASKEKVQVVLDWTPNTNHTGLYAAQKNGYFAEEGLDVEIVQPPEGGALSLVASGKAQFCISFQEEIASAITAEAPLPITAVAAIIQHNTSGIISLKEKGITRPKDMEGRKYATWGMPVEQAILKNVVTKDGGDYSKVQLVPTTVFDAVSALKTDIDTIWVYYAWDGIATEVNNLATNYFAFKDIDPALDYYTPVIASGTTYLKDHARTAKKFLNAVTRGYEYAMKNPDAAANILVEAAPGTDKNMAVRSQKYLADKYQADASQWGIIDQPRWDTFYNWMYDNKLIPRKIAPGEGFTNDYLPKK